jgi:hypothetical protein
VMLGGLVSTLFATLFVVPALYLGFGPGGRSDLDRDGPGVRQWPGIEERDLVTTAEAQNGERAAAEPTRTGEAPAADGPGDGQGARS